MANRGDTGRTAGFALPFAAKLILVPVAFAVLGLVVRYLAYLHSVPDPSLGRFAAALCKWDCFWYEGIARGGYSAFPAAPGTTGNWAFFPFYPAVIALVRIMVHAPMMVVATSISVLASISAAMLVWPLLERNWRAMRFIRRSCSVGRFRYILRRFTPRWRSSC